jgi:hypothetical protein
VTWTLAVTILVPVVGLPVLVLLFVVYVLTKPKQAQTVGGWLVSLWRSIATGVDRSTVARRIESEINTATSRLLENAPQEIVQGKLRIEWRDADEAEAILRGADEVVVFMPYSARHEDNVARALMLYLRKAVVSKARRYLDKTTMRAVDFTLAKSLMSDVEATRGSLEVFYERYLDPACADDKTLKLKMFELDELDLHGWLVQVLLPEFRRIGEWLHPSMPEPENAHESEEFAEWLYRLAGRKAGEESVPRSFDGDHLRVAVIFVAAPKRLRQQGIEPYRKEAKRLIYSREYDAVYLMARDGNMWAARAVTNKLASDGLVNAASFYEFPLRADFAKRKSLGREKGCVGCLVVG